MKIPLTDLDEYLKKLNVGIKTLNVTDADVYTALIDFEIEHVTAKALLVRLGERLTWFPLSQMRQFDGDLYASDWILTQKKGLT